jgi:NitT/TauT family transport system substrate-binding protein
VHRRRFSRTLVAALAVAALVAAAGCSDDSDKGSSGSGSSGALEKITYLTSFGNFGRDAYAYVAKDKGYFKDAGFDVDIKPGGGTFDNLQKVVAGNAQFTPLDLTGLLLAAGAKANPVTGFTSVAGIQQRTMAAIISLQGNGITTPKDLEGKTLADSPSSVVRNLFPTYAKLANIDSTKVTWQNGTPQTLIPTLASGKVAGIGQFVVGKPTVEGIAKKQAVVLPYSDVMQDLYGNVLVTSTKYAQANPDKVKKFTAALLHGLQDSINNPAEAGQTLAKDAPGATTAQAAAAELTLMGPFVKSAASGVPVGALDSKRIARSIALLEGSGQIQPGLTPEKIVDFNLVPKS